MKSPSLGGTPVVSSLPVFKGPCSQTASGSGLSCPFTLRPKVPVQAGPFAVVTGRVPAFTLLELLVVITMLGLLGAMLLPALARARMKAGVAQCLSNLSQLGVSVGLYNADNSEHYPFSGRGWPEMPFVDLWTLLNPYLGTNNNGVYRCAADAGIGFNFEWALINRGVDLQTNQLPFPCSYYYYLSFYSADNGGEFATRGTSQVRFPSQKAMGSCLVSSVVPGHTKAGYNPASGHALKGMLLLLADSHTQFAGYGQLNPSRLHPLHPSYNLDWTVNGLAGTDLR